MGLEPNGRMRNPRAFVVGKLPVDKNAERERGVLDKLHDHDAMCAKKLLENVPLTRRGNFRYGASIESRKGAGFVVDRQVGAARFHRHARCSPDLSLIWRQETG